MSTIARLMTPAEVAELLGTTPAGLSNQRYKGTGPRFVKVNGKRVMYRQADVESYIEERTFTRTDGVR